MLTSKLYKTLAKQLLPLGPKFTYLGVLYELQSLLWPKKLQSTVLQSGVSRIYTLMCAHVGMTDGGYVLYVWNPAPTPKGICIPYTNDKALG